jgi:putative transposase
MPRTARAEQEPGIYHVYARGNRKQDIYLDDRDRRRYLALLESVIGLTGWMCLSYCLMGNHMHLLIETREANLGAGMHRLQGSYAYYFNRRHDLSGRLFQSRYDAETIKDDSQFCVTAAYIARNPVAAGLCRRATDWLWSSHADVVLGCAPTWLAVDRLLAYFGADGGRGLARYIEMVDLPPTPSQSKEGQSLFTF